MYNSQVLESVKKPIVSREEMEQLVSTAERLSDELARLRASEESSAVLHTVSLNQPIVLTIALITVLFLGLEFRKLSEFTFYCAVIAVILVFSAVWIFLLRSRLKTIKRQQRQREVLSKSLDSIMNMLEEARMLYDRDLSPIEATTLNVRLQTIRFS